MNQAIENLIRVHERRIDALLKEYGTGIRPGWVSADLALEQAQIDALRRKIAEGEAQ